MEELRSVEKLLLQASHKSKLAEADLTVLGKVITEINNADTILQTHIQHAWHQHMSGVSYQATTPVPPWMDTSVKHHHDMPPTRACLPVPWSCKVSPAVVPLYPCTQQHFGIGTEPLQAESLPANSSLSGDLTVQTQHVPPEPAAQVMAPWYTSVDSAGNCHFQQTQESHMVEPYQAQQQNSWSSKQGYSDTQYGHPNEHVHHRPHAYQHQSRPQPVQTATFPVPAAVPQGWTPPEHVPEALPRRDVHHQLSQTINTGQQEYHQPAGPQQPHQAPVPSQMYTADSPVPWSTGMTSSISVPCEQCYDDAPALNTLCTPYTMPGAVLPPYPTCPCISCNPYPVPTSQYDQQLATQHMIQALPPDENKVFVSDGYSWTEFNLEKIFS